MKRFIISLLFVSLTLSSLMAEGQKDTAAVAVTEGNKQYTIATVGKIDGISWFNRMREGAEMFGEETGHDTFMQSPAQADAAQQVQIIENLIAQGVDAICVVPFSPEALEPVLKKAMDAGIVVVTHEATSQQNTDVILEAFRNEDFGAEMASYLLENMGEEGQVANFVGSLTSKSHNEQQDGVEAFIADYSSVELVSRRNEDYDDQMIAYEKTKELLSTYPNLKGIIGSASTTAPGAGLAIDESGLQDKVSVVGVGTPLDNKAYLESGAVDKIGFWDPALAAYAMNRVAVMLLDGKEITDGMDLDVAGYESLNQDPSKKNLFFANAWVFVDKNNVDEYSF
ncbi:MULTISPECIES: autoinducer 2 ABC transporter substrate-binding protein [unclassified Oceanispirochaeta]|uniref:autoinducer 2 ABC transporter substrate-binding protein n=1 Tax=unclassified Oceanispirochaeta TaxID=2635722 RepID=UPI000E090FA0|nr:MULTISPECIES: autoinducer 2 ABC transporter substrate-binding protein [unclassified Oceanispirochaeta]MBF9015822.1 autoinducer 2 ABC transporter substrate-binding protein [Oceanispirochaeta sp. M2]NPD72285.1 autoinducer 2 ABC transporter substrate-binding protein [Oceanispirochaeta sp. M1]RDG32378.1 autoinducer 2 ABC transporter substrate-binding protein [Oceanispirochaeta sp. M1]